ncbi:NADH-quinone oxidoreductase subunit C [Streptomyces longwoodensis]
MTTVGWLPAPAEQLFGPDATAEESYAVLTVDVPPTAWLDALRTARDELTCTYFDWLSAVDEPGVGFCVCAHLASLTPLRRLLLRTTVPHTAPTLPSAVDVYSGAAWHERETHEMFGVDFTGHPGLDHLLLPDNFEGHPLRKDFVLAARVAKAWPGAKEPGESDHGGPKRRQMLPPGVPDPNEWGPLKGQLPPAPARPTRTAPRPTTDRPPRRTRTTAEGSASQATSAAPATSAADTAAGAGAGAGTGAGAESGAGTTPAPAPRRTRTAAQGSASQAPAAPSGEGTGATAAAPSGPRRARSASQGSASQRAQDGPATPGASPPRPATPPRSADAPWHHARPAFDEPDPEAQARDEAQPGPAPEPTSAPEPTPAPEPTSAPEPPATEAPEPEEAPGTTHAPDPFPQERKAPRAPQTPEDPPGGPQ